MLDQFIFNCDINSLDFIRIYKEAKIYPQIKNLSLMFHRHVAMHQECMHKKCMMFHLWAHECPSYFIDYAALR